MLLSMQLHGQILEALPIKLTDLRHQKLQLVMAVGRLFLCTYISLCLNRVQKGKHQENMTCQQVAGGARRLLRSIVYRNTTPGI